MPITNTVEPVDEAKLAIGVGMPILVLVIRSPNHVLILPRCEHLVEQTEAHILV